LPSKSARVILNRRCKPLWLVDRDIEVEIEVEFGPPDG
jgi:hypothetical protein